MTDTLVFSHANGFPLPVYRRLFAALEAHGFSSTGVPRFGHDPARPPTVGWPHLIDELVEHIQALPVPGRLFRNPALAATFKFSSTVSPPKMRRRSGTCTSPNRTRASALIVSA